MTSVLYFPFHNKCQLSVIVSCLQIIPVFILVSCKNIILARMYRRVNKREARARYGNARKLGMSIDIQFINIILRGLSSAWTHCLWNMRDIGNQN